MRKVTPDRPWPLFDVAGTRRLEQEAAAALPPHKLMRRAGLATARLALALAPHARTVWIACGPGNNGGDGLEAAVHLRQWGKDVVVTLAGDPGRLPADAGRSLQRAQSAGVAMAASPPAHWDLAIDALLGIGGTRPLEGPLAEASSRMNASASPVLAVDVPSGLSSEHGTGDSVRATHTLSLLTLKPGLFTGHGRDAAGQVWFDALGLEPDATGACAWLAGPPTSRPRLHASHKGSFGDVAVIGGATGMAGAAVLAASAALHAGAGRVYLGLLDPAAGSLVAGQPELMARDWHGLPLESIAVACGCGGGEAIAAVLPEVLARAGPLVLDADGLNAVAASTDLQAALRRRTAPTVLTPHPLEAARLVGTSTPGVQADRLGSAQAIADRFGATVLLKGSGTVIAAPGRLPAINPTGSAKLATGGTGDVLAGLVAARLAAGEPAFEAASAAGWLHGAAADRWPAGEPLVAGELARRLVP